MAIFNRNKNEVIEEVPELEQYYAQRRTSGIWGWIMALITIALTVLIIIGLFYGGRWVYNQINDETTTTPTVNAPANTSTSQPSSESGVKTLPSGESTTDTATNSSQSTASNTPTATSSTSVTATPSSKIPDSGPGDVLLIALGASIVGYLLRIKKKKKKVKA